MPRNDQLIRQWHLLRQLEACAHGMTLDELLQSLPADSPRHLRTIRRDLYALEAAGIPLVNERVDGRVRWRLMDGYRHIPMLPFSPTEAMALTMGRRLLRPLQGTQIYGAVESALNKVAAALPPEGAGYLSQMHELFEVTLGSHKDYRAHRDKIERLTEAIGKKHTVQLRYFSAGRGRLTRREVDPYRLWFAHGGLYLIAYCHYRADVRLFAVERIRSLTLTDHPYQMPLHFDFESYVQDALTVMRGRRLDVELLFSKATARWVKDRIWHSSQQLLPMKDGRLKMTLTVADSEELVGWVLSFGAGVRVIKPESLRAAVLDQAKKIVNGK